MNEIKTQKDAFIWLIKERIKILNKFIKKENPIIRTIIKSTSIRELKHLLELIK